MPRGGRYRSPIKNHRTGDLVLWLAAQIVTGAQLAFYLATLVWPEGSGAEALAMRLVVWHAWHLLALQLFALVPIWGALMWRTKGRLARLLLVASFIASALLPTFALLETQALQKFFAEAGAEYRTLRWLALARWADAALALVAFVALRLAFRAETERSLR